MSDPNTPPAVNPPLDFWSTVRDEFLNGDPAAVLAERYGVSERTIRRHAAAQGWRRRDQAIVRRPSLDDIIARHPSLEPITGVNTEDLGELLLHPNPDYLRHFAFKRAAEEAALDRPTACLAWMRVVEAMGRSGERLLRDEWRVSPADRIRSLFVAEMQKAENEPLADDDAPTAG